MTRPSSGHLGFHRVAARCVLLQASVLGATIAACWWTGLRYDWRAVGPSVFLPAVAFVAWGYYAWMPGRHPRDWVIPEACLVLGLLLLFGVIVAPAQYAAAALHFPLVDSRLAAADAALGVHIPTLVAWTHTHPWLVQALFRAYTTLLPQLFLPAFVLGFWYRDRARLWEYTVLFHGCLVVTLVVSTLWPAACAFTFYGFDSLIDQSRFISQFASLRAGTFALIQPDNLEGLISFPSFHVAGALMVTWAFRARWPWFGPLIAINVALIASTMCLGAHYAVDVVATVAMFGASVAIRRAFQGATAGVVSRAVPEAERQAA